MLHYLTTGVAVAALALIGVFALQNLGAVEFSFLFWSASVSKILVILLTYALGMVTGGSLMHLVKGYFAKG